MKDRKILLAIGAGAFFILCLSGFALFAYHAFAKANTVKATLQGSFQQLQTIYKENPFPCLTNIALLQSDTAWLTNWHQSLVQDLRAIAAPTTNLSSSGFVKKLQDTSAELHRLAKADGSCMMPDGFAFGFDRYLLKGLPAPESVNRLSLQLSMIEAIVCEIIGSRVTELSLIERNKFDGGGDDTPASSRRGRPSDPAATSMAANTDDNGYTRERFAFAFTAEEKALCEVLNRLAKMPLFVVVSEVKIDRTERGLRPPPEKSGTATAQLPQSSQSIAPGPGVAPLLKTRIVVDVYTFEGV